MPNQTVLRFAAEGGLSSHDMSLTTIATYTIGGSGSSSPPHNNHPYDLVLVHGSVIDFTYPPNPSLSAIVNAANERCIGGGGIDGAINDAGGRMLIADRRALPIITTQRGGGGGGNGVRGTELRSPI